MVQKQGLALTRARPPAWAAAAVLAAVVPEVEEEEALGVDPSHHAGQTCSSAAPAGIGSSRKLVGTAKCARNCGGLGAVQPRS